MGNTVNPSSGTGSSNLKVTIIPVETQTFSTLRAMGSGLEDSVTFEQQRIVAIDPDGSAIPICEDITFSQNADKIEYQIFVDDEDEPIYSGYAYRYPDSEDNLVIDLNDILSDYLTNHIKFTGSLQEMPGFLRKFTIRSSVGSGYKIVNVYNAWEKPKTPILNDPISNVVDSRQYYFINFIDGYGNLSLYRDGVLLGSLGKIGSGVYVAPKVVLDCGESYKYDIRQNGDIVGEIDFVYMDTNKNYALYYVNAYGGWDSLAIRGNVTQTDNMQSQTYKNKTNGKVKYLNTITPTWQLYTDDMNDGSKMHHLLESTEVYLHNLETDEIVPVVITDSNCVYKTYANQGNTRFNYTINVEASNYKIRK